MLIRPQEHRNSVGKQGFLVYSQFLLDYLEGTVLAKFLFESGIYIQFLQ